MSRHAFRLRATTKYAGSMARSAPAIFAPPVCRSSRRISRVELIIGDSRFVGYDEDGGLPANIAASGASDWAERATASGAIELVGSGRVSAHRVSEALARR